MKRLALLSLLSVGLLALASALPAGAEEKSAPQKATLGQPAPQFSLPDQNGKTVNLSDYAGKVVVLEWFNPQCPYVKKFYNAGKMNELANKYQSEGVAWLAINTTKGNTPDSNKYAAEKWKVDRPILSDAHGQVARLYGAKSTPHMFIIDKDGKLIYSGAIDNQPDPDPATLANAKNYVAQALDQTLSGQPVSEPQTKPYGCGVHYEK